MSLIPVYWINNVSNSMHSIDFLTLYCFILCPAKIYLFRTENMMNLIFICFQWILNDYSVTNCANPFSPFPWFKKGSCQILGKEWHRVLVNCLEGLSLPRKKCGKVYWPSCHDQSCWLWTLSKNTTTTDCANQLPGFRLINRLTD